jgi:hypothetical protein
MQFSIVRKVAKATDFILLQLHTATMPLDVSGFRSTIVRLCKLNLSRSADADILSLCESPPNFNQSCPITTAVPAPTRYLCPPSCSCPSPYIHIPAGTGTNILNQRVTSQHKSSPRASAKAYSQFFSFKQLSISMMTSAP